MRLDRCVALLRMRVRSLTRRRQVERELEKELQFHLSLEMEEATARGMPVAEARYAALKRLGGLTQVQEECRDMRRTNFIESVGQDMRYAARTLWKSPGFTLVMLITLALSTGATSSIVSVLYGVLFRPLPYAKPDQLVRVFTRNQAWPKFPINPNDFRDFRARLHSFESFAAYTRQDFQLAGSGDPAKLSGFAITANFFQTLGIKPAIGREFNVGDELPAKGRIAIVSDAIWRERLGATRDYIGKTILLNAVPYTVVGVMPPGTVHPGNMYHAVGYGNTVDVWTPFTDFGDPNQRGSHYLDGIGRLRPGVTAAQAQGEMNAAMMQLAREHPDSDTGWKVIVTPLKMEIVGRSERLLWILLAAVGLVLLLACVNAANLMLARATARQREVALRSAVGAARTRLIRQLLTESLFIAVLGAGLGALFATAGLKALLILLPADFPRTGDIHVDAPLFLFTLLLAIGTGVVFGIVPAFTGSRADLRKALHEGGRTQTGGRATLRLRNCLVVSEVTLACVLLLGAILMLRSFVHLLQMDPGFRPEQTVTASILLPAARYKDTKAITTFYEGLLRELRGAAGIRAAGVGSDLPWTGWDDNAGFDVQGETAHPHEGFHARYHEASPGYFAALGIPVVRGRAFDEHDRIGGLPVVLISEATAKYWKHGDALGGKITFADHPKDSDWLTVIGIVKDIKDNPKSASAEPSFWWPLAQEPFPLAANSSIAIRSDRDSEVVVHQLRAALRRLDSSLALSDVRTMQHVVAENYSTPRFAFTLVAAFAGLAMMLAAIGIFGVIAYSVNQRIHDFGVRMALGAMPWDVSSGVLTEGLKLALLGTLLGLVLGVALSRLLGNLIYGAAATDFTTIGTTSLIITSVAALASLLPAMRATRVDPMTALRAD